MDKTKLREEIDFFNNFKIKSWMYIITEILLNTQPEILTDS
jgi:hypothetical protein